MPFAFPPDVKDNETPFARLPSDAQAPAIGVRKPIISAKTMRISSNPIAQRNIIACDSISELAPERSR